ncbi:hypothetical protein SKAU_G00311450 [Synaphobranchus kaupii]|uniref:Uncharacterized protein n=1 Tax=Synaphobranchus kaupii TaxID=118154 RepID=A0A9Q1ERT0_SYNKA|nr:hypothetical protein SKAU_G00311450 [Synaphobranchus kaupii]
MGVRVRSQQVRYVARLQPKRGGLFPGRAQQNAQLGAGRAVWGRGGGDLGCRVFGSTVSGPVPRPTAGNGRARKKKDATGIASDSVKVQGSAKALSAREETPWGGGGRWAEFGNGSDGRRASVPLPLPGALVQSGDAQALRSICFLSWHSTASL